MKESFTMIIADDEQNICDMLQKIITFEQLNIQLIGVAQDGVELLQMIEEKQPDIVLTDISMPRKDGLKVIEECFNRGLKIHFVMMSGYRQFEYAYGALKYNITDYLIKPIDENELNTVLEKVCKKLMGEENEDYGRSREILRTNFITTMLPNLDEISVSAEEINRTYGLTLNNGLFKFLFFVLDDIRTSSDEENDVTSVLNKISALTEECMADCCQSVVVSRIDTLVGVLLNYADEQQNEVEKNLKELFVKARSIVDIFKGIHITLCEGNVCMGIQGAGLSYKQAKVVVYSRIGCGTNKRLQFSNLTQKIPNDVLDNIKQMESQMLKQLATIDIDALTDSLSTLFALPRAYLCTKTVFDMLNRILQEHDRKRIEIIREYNSENREKEKLDIPKQLLKCAKVETFLTCLTSGLRQEMQYLLSFVEQKNSKPVRIACAYVEENYRETIYLDTVAKLVGLSAAYFSNLFSKSMGQTFSDYIAEVRIREACVLLNESDMNINEIARELSFADARSFSKLFKKRMGIKPTEYRKIYS